MTKELHQAEFNLIQTEAHHTYLLARFGDEIATRESYKANVGMDAVHFYVAHRFRWQPSRVRAMQPSDLLFLLAEDMHGWTLPSEDLP